jgi:hypothetical protein
VFLSADTEWMDYGAKRNLVKNDTRENLLGNRLVLTAPKDSKIDQVGIAPGFDLAALVGNGRIATGILGAIIAVIWLGMVGWGAATLVWSVANERLGKSKGRDFKRRNPRRAPFDPYAGLQFAFGRSHDGAWFHPSYTKCRADNCVVGECPLASGKTLTAIFAATPKRGTFRHSDVCDVTQRRFCIA